ncbi:MAG: histidine kinase [Flavobacteriaceae bacterium]|nr:MAG: histidine kinase [Flavobacteriaceae bacterium]
MEKNYIQEEQYLKAKKKVKEIKGFYIHLFITLFTIPLIIWVNLEFSPGFHWFWYATIGMSVGIFFHWLGVFGFDKIGLGKNWEEKKIKELMEKDAKLRHK